MNSPTPMVFPRLSAILLFAAISASASTYYVAPHGTRGNDGTRESPWDLASAWAGEHPIAPGSTIYLTGGIYRHPDRTWTSPGYAITLAGTAEQPIRILPLPGHRVTIDSKVEVKPNCKFIDLRDLEITVSETASWDRRVTTGGNEIDGETDLSPGGLNILGGSGSKFINLIIHGMHSGVGFWRNSVDSELHGCLLYGIGSIGPDRYHGPGIYTQNEKGTKRITDNILHSIYSTTIQAYGSKNAFVDRFQITGNMAFAPVKSGNRQRFLIGGGRPSRDIEVCDNVLYEIPLQIGYTAPHNENATVLNNRLINAEMSINRFRKVENYGNLVLPTTAPRPSKPAEAILRPNKFTLGRAHLAILNWPRLDAVAVDLGPCLKPGTRFQILNTLDYFGPPVVTGTFDGKPVNVPVPRLENTGHGEFCTYVVLAESEFRAYPK